MYIWHKETTPGTTGARCTIRDGSGLFVAECIASDAAAIVEAPAMLAALRKAQELLRDLEAPAHLEEGAALDDEAASKAWLQGALKDHFSQAEAETPEAMAAEQPEICPETAQESESGPSMGDGQGEAVADAPEGPEAHRLQNTSPEETAALLYAKHGVRVDVPAPAPDPMAELAARVAALEAMAATPLSAVSAEPPSGEAAQAKRTPAHERAVRRAWAERKAAREAASGEQAAWFQARLAQDTARNNLDCVKHWQGKYETANAKRARAALLARRRGAEMSLMAKMMKNLHAKLQVAQMAPVYASDSGRESADLVGHAMSVAFEQRQRAEVAEQSIGANRAAVERQQEAIERMADAMEAATLRAIRAETALAAIKARDNGWPPAVRSVSVKFAA